MTSDIKKEEAISAELLAQFPFLEGNVKIQRARRIWVESSLEKFDNVFEHLVERMSFKILCTISGQDEIESFTIIYHLANKDGITANLRIKIPKTEAKWKSVGNMFPGAIFYERELVDLFGVRIEGLPPGSRYPLPDNWPEGQYPLRKDWQNSNLTSKAGDSA
ncbi:NADH-quinone oxidoreductase subunit C [Verrucomicrobiota bacterium]